MARIPEELRKTISENIRGCRKKKFPDRGGAKKCAEMFGVTPQQWSLWERGLRTPDEPRLKKIAELFGIAVEDLRRKNGTPAGQLPEKKEKEKENVVYIPVLIMMPNASFDLRHIYKQLNSAMNDG